MFQVSLQRSTQVFRKAGWFAFTTLVLAAAAATPTVLATETVATTSDPFGGQIEIGEMMPNFSAVDQNRNAWSLVQETDKVVILHACALWCDPCRNLSLGLNDVIETLETEFGPETFEVVEVLIGDMYANVTDASDAQQWAQLTGGGFTVLHSDGYPTSDVEAFQQALPHDSIPQLIILDSQRRVADARVVPGSADAAEDAFRQAILHGLAVSEFPADLSYDWQGPTQVTFESSARLGTGTFVTSDVHPNPLASFTDNTGAEWFIFYLGSQGSPGTIDFWNRVENHQLVIQPASLNAAAEAVTLRLDGYLWDDGYPRVARTVLGVEWVSPDLTTITEITGVEAEVSTDGILTVGPIAIPGPWVQLAVLVEVGAVWAEPKTLTELVQELIDEIESVGLSTGSYRSLVGPLSAAAALLGDDNLANDAAGWAALRAVADRLLRDEFRDVPSELAASWAAALEALID